MGSHLVRSPYWNYLAISTKPDDVNFVMDSLEPPNNFIQSSTGKKILTQPPQGNHKKSKI
jgi:hypothetical protein